MIIIINTCSRCGYSQSELQKRANRANQLVLFFLASANFWKKNTQKQAKNSAFLVLNFFVGKIGRC